VQPEPDPDAAQQPGDVSPAATLGCPGKCGTKVVGIGVERPFPVALGRRTEPFRRLVGEQEVIRAEAVDGPIELTGLAETRCSEVANHPQHREARLAEMMHPIDQAFVDERSEQLDKARHLTDGLRGVDREAGREHSEMREQSLLLLAE
jgi:hypothetical protein